MIGEKPRKNKDDVRDTLNLCGILEGFGVAVKGLICLHFLVQEMELGLPNIDLGYERFLNIDSVPVFTIIHAEYSNYEARIQSELNLKDGRFRLGAKLKQQEKNFSMDTMELYLKHIPGKYLVKVVKKIIEERYSLATRNIDSFTYRLAEKCSFSGLSSLQHQIEVYIH